MVPAKQAEIVIALLQSGKTNKEVALMTGLSRHQVTRVSVNYVQGVKNGLLQSSLPEPAVEIQQHYRVQETLEIHGQQVLVIGDLHLPGTRYEQLQRVINEAKHYGIKHCIIAGDFLDMSKLNRHDKEWQEGFSLESEIDEANRIVKLLLQTFQRIYILRGNHDENFVRNLQWQTSFERSMRILLHKVTKAQHKRITVVDSDQCYVHTNQGKWLICHTRQSSRICGKVPSDICLIESDVCGVIGFHRHMYGIGYAPNGAIWIEGGHFVDPDVQGYILRYTSNHPKWANGGGVILFDDAPYLPMLSPLPQKYIK